MGKKKQNIVSIKMSKQNWGDLQEGLADVICWLEGFKAATTVTNNPNSCFIPSTCSLAVLNATIKQSVSMHDNKERH